jgi:hypothetical protein
MTTIHLNPVVRSRTIGSISIAPGLIENSHIKLTQLRTGQPTHNRPNILIHQRSQRRKIIKSIPRKV